MADAVQNKHRRAGRLWWRLMALGGIAIALVCGLAMPRRLQAAQEPKPSRTAAANVQPENPTTDFEPTDWPLRPVALIYVGVLVLLAVSCLVLIAAYPDALPDVDRSLRIAPPGPRLQTDAAADLQKFRADEEQRLNTYYWIDKQKGIVHIPIEQAMKKLATTGAPGFPKVQP